MLAFFHSSGKYSFSKQFLQKTEKGFAIEKACNFIIRIDISSCPWASSGSNDLITLIISSVQNSKFSVANVIFGRIDLTLSTAVHF